MRSPIILSAPSLLGSSYATTEGSPNLPGVTFNSINPFLPPQAEGPVITFRDDEGVSSQYERSRPFEFVSLVTATDFPLFSMP